MFRPKNWMNFWRSKPITSVVSNADLGYSHEQGAEDDSTS